MQADPEGRHVCGLRDTAYRGDEHSIWLRMTAAGYQRVDLDTPSVYRDYLEPKGERIPIFPLIAVLYVSATHDSYPTRYTVGIPDFAGDFGFALEQVQDLFECDPEQNDNAALIAAIQGGVPAEIHLVAEPAAPTLKPGASLPVIAPAKEINDGVGAELVVAAELMKHGWTVVYRGNQRGFGYDLEATREAAVTRIEVKSSYGFTTPELTQAEWEAAQLYGDEYILAVVDFYGGDQQVCWYLRNPAACVVPVEVAQVAFRLPRADVRQLSTEAEFL